MGLKKWVDSWQQTNYLEIRNVIAEKNNVKMENIDLTWLGPGKLDDEFHCRYCGIRKLSTSGKYNIVSHYSNKKHVELAQLSKTSQMFFNNAAPSPISKISTVVPSNSDVEHIVASTSNKVAEQKQLFRSAFDAFTNKDASVAEILWTLHIVDSNMSINSNQNAVSLQQRMYPDSVIAKNVKLSASKIRVMITFGLSPYIRTLKSKTMELVSYFTISFDESYNRISQQSQMDIVTKHFDKDTNLVSTRYHDSRFLLRTTADNLIEELEDSFSPPEFSKSVQLSLDGPSTMISVLNKLNAKRSPEQVQLIPTGTCGLHTLHNSLKTGLENAGFEISTFLRYTFYLFNKTPATRGKFIEFTGDNDPIFPKKYCSTRWLENRPACETILKIFDDIKNFVSVPEENELKVGKLIRSLQTFFQDKLLRAKLMFSSSMCSDFEPFLSEFQSPEPKLPFLFAAILKVLRCLLKRVLKSKAMDKLKTSNDLISCIESMKIETNKTTKTIVVFDSEIFVDLKQVDIGLKAGKFMKASGAKEADILKLYLDCRVAIVLTMKKIVEKSPIKYSFVRNSICFDPAFICSSSSTSKEKLKKLVEQLFEANIITEHCASMSRLQFDDFCSIENDVIKNWSKIRTRIDTFYGNIMANSESYPDLWFVVRVVLIFFHGNADVESGFSVNKDLLTPNQTTRSLVALRRVKDFIKNEGGLENIEVNDSLIRSCKNSRTIYNQYLQKEKEEEKKIEETKSLTTKLEKKISELESKKKRIESEKDIEVMKCNDELNSNIDILQKLKKKKK